MKRIIFIFFILFIFISCKQNKIPKEVLKLTEERMQLYYYQQDSICHLKAMQKAEAAVDSFFLSIRQQYLHDSIAVPDKPIKPIVDTNINLDVSKPIRPLWDTLKIK